MEARLDFPDGAGGRERLAFSAPRRLLAATTLGEIVPLLAAAEAEADAGRWVLGFVAYEAAPAFDAALAVRAAEGPLPLAAFAVFDAPAAAPHAPAGAFACSPWRMDMTPATAQAAVGRIRAGIAAGDYYQVNLTARLGAEFSGDAAALFAALVESQPDGYGLFLEAEGWALASVSPELFFDRRGGRLTTRPMKGTAARDPDPARDAAARDGLAASAKERAENLMIVDLLRNDLARVAQTGSVRVPRLFEIQALPTAWQMTSTVECAARAGLGLAEIFGALFPCGSVTGAPKVAAMRAIGLLEAGPRGAYCGAIGVIRPGGHATFNVGIRTVSIDKAGGRAECGVGSGIVADSDPAGEYAEWLVKRRFLLRASAHFELLETLKLEKGQYWLLERHLERLAGSAAHFGFALDPDAVRTALAEVATVGGLGAFRVRLLVDRAGRARAERFALEPMQGEVEVGLGEAPIASDDEFLRHKTTERSAYGRFVPPPGAFDVLLWNERGELTEFTKGNVVVELDGRRLTPPDSCGLLAGVLRAELLARAAIEEGIVMRTDLARATGLWFINSVRGEVRARLVTQSAHDAD